MEVEFEMKSRIRNLGALTIAVFALLVIGAQAASAALPEFRTGGAAVSFTSTSGAGTLETVGGRTVRCNTDSNEGEVANAKEARNVVVRFFNCTAEGGLLNCGEIVTNPLNGTLYYLDKAKTEVGLDLEPESGGNFTTFTCNGPFGIEETLSVTGSVVGKITPINTLTNTFELSLKQTGGIQQYTGYYNEAGTFVEDVLMTSGSGFETFGPEQSGEETSDTITTAIPIEIAG
jgi:hypothetical protein